MGIDRTPTNRSEVRPAPRVWLKHGTGAWALDERLRVLQIDQTVGIDGGRALLEVRRDKAPPAYTDFYNNFIGDYCGLNDYVMVDTGEEAAESRSLLFLGRIVSPPFTLGGDGRNVRETFQLECEHACRDEINATVLGRVVNTANGTTRQLPIPCVFNFNNRPNRAAALTSLGYPTFSPYVDGMDPTAVPWNFASIIVYLISRIILQNDTYDFSFHLFEEILLTAMPLMDTPPALPGIAMHLGACPNEMNLENLTFDRAMDQVLGAAGLEYSHPFLYGLGGEPYYGLHVWAPGYNTAVRNLKLQNPTTDPQGWRTPEPAADVLARNNINQASVSMNCQNVITGVRMIGSPYRVEFTHELVPGWPADQWLDMPQLRYAPGTSHADAVIKAKAEAVGQVDAYTSRFVASKARTNGKLIYGRKWILNEDGAMGIYANGTGPYHRDWTDLRAFFELDTWYPNDPWNSTWVHRPRPLLDCLTLDHHGKSHGIVVEISFDGGGTWQHKNDGIIVLPDRAGIYIDHDDLVNLVPKWTSDPDNFNFWCAILEGLARVRVTGTVELDERSWVHLQACEGIRRWAVVQDRTWRNWRRHSSSIFQAPPDYDPGAQGPWPWADPYINDEPAMASLGNFILNQHSQYDCPSTFVCPWVETLYDVGDAIEKVEGRNWPLRAWVGSTSFLPEIRDITHRFDWGFSTELRLRETK